MCMQRGWPTPPICGLNAVLKMILFLKSSFLFEEKENKLFQNMINYGTPLAFWIHTNRNRICSQWVWNYCTAFERQTLYKQSALGTLAKTADYLMPSYFCRSSNEDLDILSWWWYISNGCTAQPSTRLALHHCYFTVMASTSMEL